MQTSIFDFYLPPERIASEPASPRDSARMLVVDYKFFDEKITDLLSHLRSGDVLVFNDTKVIPARLIGRKGETKIEILLHKKMAENNWQCFAKPAKKLRIGEIVDFAEDFWAEVTHKYDDGQVSLKFPYNDMEFYQKLKKYGTMPLPPYIEKIRLTLPSPSRIGQGEVDNDKKNYQTVYARHAGSVAAPTAGLHFTDALLAKIDSLGVKRVHVTLHVGGGTFLPVKVDDTKDHKMHSEYAEISAQAAETINSAKANGGRVIAVGTTSVRTLESAADADGKLKAFAGETNIFITPGYKFKIVDMMLTNFHLPKSTLFMLVCAFTGIDRMKAAYTHAIANNYRFYSYGDACLLYKSQI